MSTSNKVFVEINAEDERKVLAAVCKKVNEEIRKELDRYIEEETEYTGRLQYLFSDEAKEKKYCTNGVSVSTNDYFGGHYICFTYKAEERMIHCALDCECDVKDYLSNGKKAIIFSVNHWGAHKEIMQWVIEACSLFGKVWQKENDAKDEWEVAK